MRRPRISEEPLAKGGTARADLALERLRVAERYATLRTAIKWAGVCGSLYVGKELVIALAGHETAVSVSLAFLGDWKTVLSYIAGGAGVSWGYAERRLRHNTIDRLQGRIRELETMHDPKRTSSGLTTQGKTHPKDKRP